MSTPTPYHERQSWFNQNCLVHALNMLIGKGVTSKEKLDEVCDYLHHKLSPDDGVSWWPLWLSNPHRGIFGGNYDVNVAMYVLQQEHHLDATFFDGRKTANELVSIISPKKAEVMSTTTIDKQNDNGEVTNISAVIPEDANIVGLLVNIAGSMFRPGSRHWISYRSVNSIWWRLDSKKAEPIQIPTRELLSTMELHLSKGDHVFIVKR